MLSRVKQWLIWYKNHACQPTVKEITAEWRTPALRYLSHSPASIGGCHFLKIFLDTAKLLCRAWTMGIKSSIEFWYTDQKKHNSGRLVNNCLWNSRFPYPTSQPGSIKRDYVKMAASCWSRRPQSRGSSCGSNFAYSCCTSMIFISKYRKSTSIRHFQRCNQ